MWIRMSLSLSQLFGGLTARLRREEGQTMAEYALILTLITLAIFVAIAFLGTNIGSAITRVADLILP